MGLSKTEYFSKEQNSLSILMKALSHPARIAIVEYLAEVNTCICGDIVGKIPLAQPTVSQHLKELKLAGIIKGSIDGNSICYCLNNEKILELKNYIDNLLTHSQTHLKDC